MIHRIVQAALRQRFLVLVLTGFITVGGIISFQKMPVDAYPDLSPPQVEIITQWPGHAAEEVERLVSLPLELEMNGTPHMSVMRSISLYGLSDIRLDLRGRHRRLLRPPNCFRAHGPGHSSNRSDTQPGAALQPQWTGISLRY